MCIIYAKPLVVISDVGECRGHFNIGTAQLAKLSQSKMQMKFPASSYAKVLSLPTPTPSVYQIEGATSIPGAISQ